MSKINTMKIRLLFIVTLLAGIVSACGEKDIAVFERLYDLIPGIF